MARAVHQTTFQFPPVTFNSSFDSGNLLNVKKISLLNYQLWVGSDIGSNYKSWFYFQVSGVPTSHYLTLTIMNFNNHQKLLEEGLVPVFKSGDKDWQRIKSPISKDSIRVNQEGIQFTFRHYVQAQSIKFSFVYPWSNSDQAELLQQICPSSDLYFHQCALTFSRQGRPVHLLTVSSKQNINGKLDQISQSNIFPDKNFPARFKNKKAVIITARVHPGQVPSSHVMTGIIKYLLLNSKYQQILTENFVFYLVPIINPDGVARGHFRFDSRGVNLNRCFINPKPKQHSSIYAIKKLILLLNGLGQFHSYIDLHAHAGRKGCFIYGNYSNQLQTQHEICLYPKLLSLYNQDFDYEGSNFTEQNMYSKDRPDQVSKQGSGRVAIFKKTKNGKCWTVECSYNMSKFLNINYSSKNIAQQPDNYLDYIQPEKFESKVFYKKRSYQRLGQSILQALLELQKIHPQSLLPYSPFKNIQNLCVYQGAMLLKMQPFQFQGGYRRLLHAFSQISKISQILKALLFNQKKILNLQQFLKGNCQLQFQVQLKDCKRLKTGQAREKIASFRYRQISTGQSIEKISRQTCQTTQRQIKTSLRLTMQNLTKQRLKISCVKQPQSSKKFSIINLNIQAMNNRNSREQRKSVKKVFRCLRVFEGNK